MQSANDLLFSLPPWLFKCIVACISFFRGKAWLHKRASVVAEEMGQPRMAAILRQAAELKRSKV